MNDSRDLPTATAPDLSTMTLEETVAWASEAMIDLMVKAAEALEALADATQRAAQAASDLRKERERR